MSEPTIKDVLKAIEKLATKADLDVKIDGLRAEMNKRLDDLDQELTGHAKVHREIEKDIAALKGRAPRTAARRAAPRRR